VDINTADVEELDELPEVGPSTAQSIIDYRENHGQFRTVGELAAMHNRKTVVDGFAFSVLVNEDGAGRLELTKA
jgi:transcriptional accessory protein Tex/SPT6